jgi:DNA mismatch repair protein MutL
VTDHADRSEYAPKQLDIADAAASAQAPEQLPSGGAEGLSWRIVGELFNTYIVYEEGDTVTVADKHAAHERIIFEKLRRGLSGLDRPQVLLAVPIELDMTAADAAAVEDCRDSIEKTGFSFSVSGTSVSVTAIPDGIPAGAVGDMFQCFAEAAPGGGGSVELAGSAVFEKALFTASCRAAVKAGRVYPEGYSSWLVAEMHRYPEATCCPHGRPVAFTFKKSEFDRRFGRI